jgi:ArsR family transcriptional regulator
MTDNGKPTALSVEGAAALFKLLGGPHRLRLLAHLDRHDKASVSELCRALGQTQPTVSHELTLLRLGGLVDCRRDGKSKRYSLTSPTARELLGFLRA